MSRSDKSSEVQICDWITPRSSSFRVIGALLVPTRLMLSHIMKKKTGVKANGNTNKRIISESFMYHKVT